MEFDKQRSIFDAIRRIDLVNYLSSLGHEPVKIRGQAFWYLSPLRSERTASFRVDRIWNCWKDWGTGEWGNVIDFALKYNDWTIGELLHSFSGSEISFDRTVRSKKEMPERPRRAIKILKENRLYAYALLAYLKDRRIPIEIATVTAWRYGIAYTGALIMQ